ncbi:MAG: sce7726 family protein [Deltaproteobacteria bacterium]|nr:sce7726 family protein [Deltaproteobacteria bacterium]
MEIDPKYLPALGRLFTPIVMDSLEQKGYSPYLSEVCANSGLLEKLDSSTTLGQFFDWVYRLLFKNYRNEYIYKNVLANKILIGKHSLNTSHMLTEFRAGKNKADVVILNGTTTVYEIKSQYDSFARLEKQIQSYFEIFDYINVITSPSHAKTLDTILPEKAGVLVLTDRNTITTIRKPKSNKENINPAILFDSLRKSEYMRIIKEYYGTTLDVPNTQIYRKCKKLYCEIPPDYAHELTVKILKGRNNSKILKDFIDKAPSSVSAYAISISGQEKKLQKIMALFDNKIDSLLIPNTI